MNLKVIFLISIAFFFLFAGFLILYDQYTLIGVWFQMQDLHHETFALVFFALAIGILIGAIISSLFRQDIGHELT